MNYGYGDSFDFNGKLDNVHIKLVERGGGTRELSGNPIHDALADPLLVAIQAELKANGSSITVDTLRSGTITITVSSTATVDRR